MNQILVVEDDVWQRQHYVKRLKSSGFSVISVGHALDAIEAVDDEKIDLILLDMMLPGANGIALLQELSSHSDLSKIPVLVMSTHSELKLEQLRPYGVVEVIDKSTMSLHTIADAAKKALA